VRPAGLAVLVALVTLPACGGSTSAAPASYDRESTKACLAQDETVLVNDLPRTDLQGVQALEGVVSVTWALGPETPPASALVLFADSDEDEPALESSLQDVVQRVGAQYGVKGRDFLKLLSRSGNAAWFWVAPHRKAEPRALRRCLEASRTGPGRTRTES
jgi:hypothetical protein